MIKNIKENTVREIFFGMYSDGKEGAKDGREHAFIFLPYQNNIPHSDYQF